MLKEIVMYKIISPSPDYSQDLDMLISSGRQHMELCSAANMLFILPAVTWALRLIQFCPALHIQWKKHPGPTAEAPWHAYETTEPDGQGPSLSIASGEGTPNFFRDILQEAALQ